MGILFSEVTDYLSCGTLTNMLCTDVKDPDAHRHGPRRREGEGHVIGGPGGRKVTSRGVEWNGSEVTSQSDAYRSPPRVPRTQSIKTSIKTIRESQPYMFHV